jgi:beta-glucosidase
MFTPARVAKVLSICFLAVPTIVAAQGTKESQPWRDTTKTPDARAHLLSQALTLDEKISLLHGIFALPVFGAPLPADAIGSGGYVPGVPRLGIPSLQETDASLGVTNPVMGLGLNIRPNDVATALPASIALAATFNRNLAYSGGAMVGAEARAKGFNVLLSGGVNLARDPRGGRNFEYLGEDPYLAGTLGGETIRGIEGQKIIATVKHFAMNDSETNRHWSNSVIDEEAMRESDLLAFEIAIETGKPGSVMCSYNLINGAYGCGNDFLLNTVLKGDWGYKGFVMSDWGAVYATDFAAKGLDQQSGQELDEKVWFGEPLKAEVKSGAVSQARLDDMVVRILRTQINSGIYDTPTKAPTRLGEGIDYKKDAEISRAVAGEGIVLLKNTDGLLPLAASAKSILVIGDHVETGVLSGGGSSNVRGSNSQLYVPFSEDDPLAQYIYEQYHASSPLAAIKALAPNAAVRFDNGANGAEAARKARMADVVIVFGNQWMTETADAPNLSLPHGQDEMIAKVTAANPHTVVVLQTGGPVDMPWLNQAGAVIEAWYSGQEGGSAIADVLFGNVNPSGRLPVTFPKSVEQYPRKSLPGFRPAREGRLRRRLFRRQRCRLPPLR